MAPVLTALALASTLVSTSHHPSTGLPSIDAVCAAPAGRARIFVETSGAVLPKPREGVWRELASEAELHGLAEGEHPPNTEAIVRDTRGGKLVSMYFQDASTSWAHVVDYCFRASGPLARLRGTFNSFTAAAARSGIRRRRTIDYDADGGVLRSKTAVFDLDTDRPLPGASFLDEADPLYPALRALPFAADLLPPVAAADPDPDAAFVRERLPAVKACFDRALKRKPGLAGKAVGRWTVDVAGQVTAFSWQTDELGSPTFGTCARKVIESWRFPTRGAPTTVSFPFVFGRSGDGLSLAP